MPLRTDTGGIELLPRIKELWQELRQEHAALNPPYRDAILTTTFEVRSAELTNKGARVLVSVIHDEDGQQDVGFSIASTIGAKGEIDSLYLRPEYRNRQQGSRLTKAALHWLKDQGAASIYVNVLHGNTEALRFYARFGFHPRSLNLYQVGDQ